MIRHFLQRVRLGHSPWVRREHAVDVRPDLDRAVRVASSSKESRPSPLPRFRAPRSQQPPKNGRRVIRAVAFERGRRAVLARCDEAGDDELRADTCRRAIQQRRGLREQSVASEARAAQTRELESAREKCGIEQRNRTRQQPNSSSRGSSFWLDSCHIIDGPVGLSWRARGEGLIINTARRVLLDRAPRRRGARASRRGKQSGGRDGRAARS